MEKNISKISLNKKVSKSPSTEALHRGLPMRNSNKTGSLTDLQRNSPSPTPAEEEIWMDWTVPLSTINVDKYYITTYLPCNKIVNSLDIDKYNSAFVDIEISSPHCTLQWEKQLKCFYIRTIERPNIFMVNLSIPSTLIQYQTLLTMPGLSSINYQFKSTGEGLEKYNYSLKNFTLHKKILDKKPDWTWEVTVKDEKYFLIPIPRQHSKAIWTWLADLESLSVPNT